MYKCYKCGNVNEFKEFNTHETYIEQEDDGDIIYTGDDWAYREDVICLNCDATFKQGHVRDDYFPEKDIEILKSVNYGGRYR